MVAPPMVAPLMPAPLMPAPLMVAPSSVMPSITFRERGRGYPNHKYGTQRAENQRAVLHG